MRVAEAFGQPFNLALAHYSLAEAYASRGMVESAVPLLERGLAISQAGDFQVVLTMGWLGYARALLGRADEGVALLEQSVAQAEAIEFIGGMAGIMPLQSDAYLRAGRLNEARASAERGLEICRRLKRRGMEAEVLHVLGKIAATSAPLDADAAEAHYRQAMALARERDIRPLVAHCHFGLGKLSQRTSNREQARDHLATATMMYREMDMRLWLSQAETAMAELA
jgi:tetratricopeptide (TPR) repeat protein